MGIKTLIRLGDQALVKTLLATPDLSPATSKIARRFGSKAKATRHTPLLASNLSSFIFA
jgi:hypothetical protein